MAERFPTLGGHECSFTENIPDDLICLICTFVAKDPEQVTCCGKVFCSNCLEGLGEDKPCPHCREDGWKSFPDKRSSRNILGLKIECSNSSEGCDWTGELRGQDDHGTVCGYELIECENECSDSDEEITEILRKDSKIHLQEICPNRLVRCELCEEEGKYCDITGDHIDECPEVIVGCYNEGCEEMVKRGELENGDHKRKCQYALVGCKYSKYGCDSFPRRDKLDHHEQDTDHHLEVALKTIDRLNKRLDIQEKNDQLSKIKQAKLLDAVKIIDKRVQNLQGDVTSLKPKPASSWHFPPPKLGSALDDSQSLVVATFKMTDYESHRQNKTRFDSSPFYTSPDGYRMEVNVIPSDNHISLYVQVVPGENDANLSWPINYMKIEVQILNQKSDRMHHSIHVHFDGSIYYVRPAYTQPLAKEAVQIRKLTEEYTCNDTLYFRVTVHKRPPGCKPWLVCTV